MAIYGNGIYGNGSYLASSQENTLADKTANFETGTAGNAIGTSDTGSSTAFDAVYASASTTVYDATHVHAGSLAAKVTAPGGVNSSTGSGFSWTTAATDHYGRVYLYLTANPTTSDMPIIQCSSPATRNARLDITTAGKIRYYDSPASGTNITTNTIALNQWIRLEFHFIHSATVGQIEVKLFNSAESTTPTETLTSPASLNTGASAGGIFFGTFNSVSNCIFWMDDVVANATAYPGPVVASPSNSDASSTNANLIASQARRPHAATARSHRR